MKPRFDIEGLRSMVVGTELGGFQRAAVQLGRSQSAVSMQLKRLEEQAGQALFQRSGRGLVPTEAGEALLAYARKIVALHDEAAAALGTTVAAPAVRLGLPQDFFEDAMPDALHAFSAQRPGTHVDVRAGRNFALEQEVKAGRLDVALAFSEPGRTRTGERLASLPMRWLAREGFSIAESERANGLPLVLFDHPCLFRQAATRALDAAGIRWRLSLTTPSLPGIWAALHFGLGISVRTGHGVPTGIGPPGTGLPRLPPLELRMLLGDAPSPAALELAALLRETVARRLSGLSRT